MGAGCKMGEHLLKFELDIDSSADISSAAVTATQTADGGDQSAAQSSSIDLISLGELAVREKLSVVQLKELLLSKWSTIAAAVKKESGIDIPTAPASADHLRLRDGKVRDIVTASYNVIIILCFIPGSPSLWSSSK
jgi:hypothetical protein